MSKLRHYPEWYMEGVNSGWIGIYERELVHFLEEEYGSMSEFIRLVVVFVSLFRKAGHTYLPLDQTVENWVAHLDLTVTERTGFPDMRLDQLFSYTAIGRPDDDLLFVIDENRFYIRRFYKMEDNVVQRLNELISEEIESVHEDHLSPLLDQVFPPVTKGSSDYQRIAGALSLVRKFLVISGGPGTGKTTTIARILALLVQTSEKPLRIALAAPTGKAAARMSEAIYSQIEEMDIADRLREQIPREAKTLHRLLRGREATGLLPPSDNIPLQYDVLIIDEASMIDLTLFQRVLESLDTHTRLILLGDRDQLSSVEAGSVLGDLCAKNKNGFSKGTIDYLLQSGFTGNIPERGRIRLDDSILYLTKNYRFSDDSGIAVLSDAVKRQDLKEIDKILESDNFPDIGKADFSYTVSGFQGLFSTMKERLKQTRGLLPEELLKYWTGSVWLTALRNGPFGTLALNRLIEEDLIREKEIRPREGWYHGRPVLITRNDYSLGIFNGDLGVCCQTNDETLNVIISNYEGGLKSVPVHRIQYAEPAFFLTVHKAQGSEFNQVTFLLPAQDTPLLTKELIYTAITRARVRFDLLGDLAILHKGIERETVRYSSLGRKLFK